MQVVSSFQSIYNFAQNQPNNQYAKGFFNKLYKCDSFRWIFRVCMPYLQRQKRLLDRENNALILDSNQQFSFQTVFTAIFRPKGVEKKNFFLKRIRFYMTRLVQHTTRDFSDFVLLLSNHNFIFSKSFSLLIQSNTSPSNQIILQTKPNEKNKLHKLLPKQKLD